MSNKSNKAETVVKDNATVNQPVVLTAEKFSITEVGTYSYNDTVINVTEVTRDSGRKIHITGTIDGEQFKGDIMKLKSRFGIATKVYNTNGTTNTVKVLTDEEITKKVATFAGSLSNCLTGLNKVLSGVGNFVITFTDNENNDTDITGLTSIYRETLIANNEENKKKKAEAEAKKKEREETKERENLSKDIKILLMSGKIAEAMQILQSMQN